MITIKEIPRPKHIGNNINEIDNGGYFIDHRGDLWIKMNFSTSNPLANAVRLKDGAPGLFDKETLTKVIDVNITYSI